MAVFLSQMHDEFFNLLIESWPTIFVRLFVSSFTFDQLIVPAYHGWRSEDSDGRTKIIRCPIGSLLQSGNKNGQGQLPILAKPLDRHQRECLSPVCNQSQVTQL